MERMPGESWAQWNGDCCDDMKEDAYSALASMTREAGRPSGPMGPIHPRLGRVLTADPLKVDVAGTIQEAERFYISRRLVKGHRELLELECQGVNGALAQPRVETATWGLRYWEETLGIPVDEGKDLDTRRSRVRVKLLGSDVTTVALVKSSAEIWSGQKAEVTEYADQFRFEIRFVETNGVPPNMRDVTGSIRELIPAHPQWDYIFFYDVESALGVGAGLVTEAREELEVWPRDVRSVEITKAAAVGAVTEHHGRIEVYPAEQEEP